MSLKLPDSESIKKAAASWLPTTNNEGRFDLAPGISLAFKKIGGGWVVDGSKLFDSKEELQGTTKTQYRLLVFIKKYSNAIGYPGITGEDINYQMGKDLMSAIMGFEFTSGNKPAITNRFNIETLNVK